MGCVFEGGAQRIKGRQDSHGLEAELIQRIEANSSREINYLIDTLIKQIHETSRQEKMAFYMILSSISSTTFPTMGTLGGESQKGHRTVPMGSHGHPSVSLPETGIYCVVFWAHLRLSNSYLNERFWELPHTLSVYMPKPFSCKIWLSPSQGCFSIFDSNTCSEEIAIN